MYQASGTADCYLEVFIHRARRPSVSPQQRMYYLQIRNRTENRRFSSFVQQTPGSAPQNKAYL